MTPVIKSEEIINQIRQLQDELNEMARSLMTFPTKSKQNRMKKIDDTLSAHWKDLHTLYPEITSEDIADYENLPSRSMDATVDSELECLDMLQDFKDGKLVVQLINSYQYEKFINYLKENDVTINSAMEYTQNPSHFPYFYMLRPGMLTAGESYKAIQDYVHINKLVPLGVFMPAFEKTVQKTVEPKVKSQAKQETIPLSVYVQVKSERDIAIEQLDALGTSFGEKSELALSRIENNVIDRVFAAIKEKSDVLCDMVRNHYGTPNDIVQDFTESLGSIIDSVRDDLDNDITVEHDLEQDEREL